MTDREDKKRKGLLHPGALDPLHLVVTALPRLAAATCFGLICCVFVPFSQALRAAGVVWVGLVLQRAIFFDRRVIRADEAAEASYEKPLGPVQTGNPVVFFDIDIGGNPVGRIEIELKASHVPKAGIGDCRS